MGCASFVHSGRPWHGSNTAPTPPPGPRPRSGMAPPLRRRGGAKRAGAAFGASLAEQPPPDTGTHRLARGQSSGDASTVPTYDEIQPGESATFSKTIGESDVYLFAGITGDFNPAHIDSVTAADGVFGQRVAHGMLTASFISTVLGTRLPGPGTVYLSQEIQFRAPVFIGETVTATVECVEKLEQRQWLKFRTTITNQDGKTVITGQATVIPPAAPA